ncbi:MAG: energy transducer TonB, partial [Acidobacteriales bacterium]|nr:energy transducer TonB [Terriglobales bacterium]
MSNLSGFVVSYLVNAVWEVVLIAGAGWLVSRMVKRVGPQAEHVVWVSTLGLATVMPALPLLRWLLALLYVPHAGGGSSSITVAAA